MRLRYLGYACQNLTLGTKVRTVRKANLTAAALRPVVADNLRSLEAMLRWNVRHGIRFFRVSSDLVPFGSLPEFPFDWAEVFAGELEAIRRFVEAERLRVTCHPGQYTVLNSPREDVVAASVRQLEHEARMLACIAPGGTMTLHVGGVYGDREAALARFEANLPRLSDGARAMLALENDDTSWPLADVVALGERTGLPVIVDFFHHRLLPSGATPDDGFLGLLERAMRTWGRRVPKLHLSSHRPGTRTGHADFLDMADVDHLTETMALVGAEDAPYDLMLEAKHKEVACLEVMRYLATGEAPARAIPMAEAS